MCSEAQGYRRELPAAILQFCLPFRRDAALRNRQQVAAAKVRLAALAVLADSDCQVQPRVKTFVPHESKSLADAAALAAQSSTQFEARDSARKGGTYPHRP